MKNFTKICLVVFFLLFSMHAFSQNIIISGGLNVSNVQIKSGINFQEDNPKVNPGFHLGALIGTRFSNVVSLTSGLFLETRGDRWVSGVPSDQVTTSMTPIYLSVPLNLRLTFEIRKLFKLYGQMGPYLGFGIGGNTAIYSNGNKVTESMFNSDRFEAFKRLDYGLSVGAGVEVDRIMIGLGFDLGTANFINSGFSDLIYRNRTLKLSVGFKVGGE